MADIDHFFPHSLMKHKNMYNIDADKYDKNILQDVTITEASKFYETKSTIFAKFLYFFYLPIFLFGL